MSYYVYLHKKATTGEVFYIGKGKGNRAWSRESRNKFWKAVEKKHGFIVEIFMDNIQEWYALELEKELICKYGRRNNSTGILTNITDGGEGVSGLEHTDENKSKASLRSSGINNPRADQKEYRFVNIYTKEVFTGTRVAMKGYIGKSVADLFNSKTYSIYGWMLEGTKELYRHDPTVYTFKHKSGNIFSGNRKDFTEKFGIDPKTIFGNKPKLTVKDWYLFENEKLVQATWPYQYRVIAAKHISGDIFEGTLENFSMIYGFSIGKLFHEKTRSRTWKGWAVI